MNIQQALRMNRSRLEVSAEVGQLDAAAYETASPFKRIGMLVTAGVEDPDFKDQLEAALGLTQGAAQAGAGARDRFDEAAGQSKIDLRPGKVFADAIKWLGPNIIGLPQKVATASRKAGGRVQNPNLAIALVTYFEVCQTGGVVAMGRETVTVLSPQLRSEVVTEGMELWRKVGMDEILAFTSMYAKHEEISASTTGMTSSSLHFKTPSELWDMAKSAMFTISKTVEGTFNQGFGAILGQEFDLLLLPAMEDRNFVIHGFGVQVENTSPLQALLDSEKYSDIRAAKLLAEAMAAAVMALFDVQEDLKAYAMNLGKAGIKYSTALKRFLAAGPKPVETDDEMIISITMMKQQLVQKAQAVLVNTGNIVAGAGGVAAQNIERSTIVTGSGNQVSTFNQANQQVYGNQVNTGGGGFIAGSVNMGGGGDLVMRDKVNYGDQVYGDSIGLDEEELSEEEQRQRQIEKVRRQAQRQVEQAQRQAEKAQRRARRGW